MLKSREAHRNNLESRRGVGGGEGAAVRTSKWHPQRSIASSDRQVMSRHARRERDRHRQREREGERQTA